MIRFMVVVLLCCLSSTAYGQVTQPQADGAKAAAIVDREVMEDEQEEADQFKNSAEFAQDTAWNAYATYGPDAFVLAILNTGDDYLDDGNTEYGDGEGKEIDGNTAFGAGDVVYGGPSWNEEYAAYNLAGQDYAAAWAHYYDAVSNYSDATDSYETALMVMGY